MNWHLIPLGIACAIIGWLSGAKDNGKIAQFIFAPIAVVGILVYASMVKAGY